MFDPEFCSKNPIRTADTEVFDPEEDVQHLKNIAVTHGVTKTRYYYTLLRYYLYDTV